MNSYFLNFPSCDCQYPLCCVIWRMLVFYKLNYSYNVTLFVTLINIYYVSLLCLQGISRFVVANILGPDRRFTRSSTKCMRLLTKMSPYLCYSGPKYFQRDHTHAANYHKMKLNKLHASFFDWGSLYGFISG